MTRNQIVVDASGGGLVAVLGNIYQQGVAQSLPWLIAMTLVVIADLATGMRKVWLLGQEPLRFSTGMRRTMSKLVTYWALCLCAVAVNIASGCRFDIDMWACLWVCVVEASSIANNLLKPHGIELSMKGILRAISSKTNVDVDGVVVKTKKTRKSK